MTPDEAMTVHEGWMYLNLEAITPDANGGICPHALASDSSLSYAGWDGSGEHA